MTPRTACIIPLLTNLEGLPFSLRINSQIAPAISGSSSTWLRLYWPPCCTLYRPRSFLPQGLCTCSSFCLVLSFFDICRAFSHCEVSAQMSPLQRVLTCNIAPPSGSIHLLSFPHTSYPNLTLHLICVLCHSCHTRRIMGTSLCLLLYIQPPDQHPQIHSRCSINTAGCRTGFLIRWLGIFT